MDFAQWSDCWKEMKKDVGNVDRVMELWRLNVPSGCQRNTWNALFCYRHNHKAGGQPRGEQMIEKKLLPAQGKKSKEHALFRSEKPTLTLQAIGHKMPMANQSRGQIITDVLGILTVRNVNHPIAIEVKTTDQDPWFAVVENLLQIKMLRNNVGNVLEFFKQHGIANCKGAWGMVLAPRKYYQKDKQATENALRLIERLKKESQARLMLISYREDSNSESLILDFHGGFWPRD